MTLSQTPCVGSAPGVGGACCNSQGTTCSNWAGSHIVSLGCIQFGLLEMHLAVNLPPAGGGFYFTATYMVRGSPDPSWNEIDVGFVNGPYGLEFHATVFTAAPSSPTVTTQDALSFAPYPLGTSNNGATVNVINGQKAAQMYYNATFAASFHAYKVLWTPTWQAWMIDTVVYRNISYSIWRPQSIRQILRTNIGTPAATQALPDSNIYIKRITYLPLSPQTIQTALTCSSNFACNGPINMGQYDTASGVFSVAASPSSSSGRRHLLQTATSDGLNAIAGAVANSVPGVPANGAKAYHLGYYFDFNIRIANMRPSEMQTNPAVHAALVNGLDTDIGHVGPSNVIVKSVTQGASATETLVTATIDGFASLDTATAALAAITKSAGTKITAEFIDKSLGRPQVTDPVDFYKTAPGQGVTVTVYNSTLFSTVGVAVDCATHDVDKYEAAIGGAVNSGYVSSGLKGSLAGARVAPVSTVQAQRATRNLKGKRGTTMPAPKPPPKPAVAKSPPASGGKPSKKPNKKPTKNGRHLF